LIVPRSQVADVEAVAAHYDDLDELYRGFWGTSLHHGYWIAGNESPEEAVDNLTRLIAQRAGFRFGEQVCDLGCGYGAAASLWQREFGAEVTGLTISEQQFRYGKSTVGAHSSIRLIHGDALQSGLPAGAFDVVTAIESSEHMPDKQKFFAEAGRLLRAGGRLVVAAWLTRERPTELESRLLLNPICREGRLPSMGSAAEYVELMIAAGFRDIRTSDITAHVKRTWSVCARRVGSRLFRDAAFRRMLFDRQFTNRVFALTVFRIWLAYQTGSMRFGLFSARKPRGTRA
jgi:tocopherol O-methyltransferase